MTDLSPSEYEELGRQLEAFCKKYNIRIEDFFPILNDQKVIPMLRGKASEYDAVYTLRSILPSQIWIVNKLNLNPQPGIADQDIGVTHRRTGVQVIIETKNAVRGSMKTGHTTRICREPHFRVKCHRSRSNTSAEYNDRYLVGEFDLIISTPTNAFFKSGTIGEDFELVDELGVLEILMEHYGVSDELSLIDAANKDWRFVAPSAIGENYRGHLVIPRDPIVQLKKDLNWSPLDQIQPALEAIVRAKQQARRS